MPDTTPDESVYAPKHIRISERVHALRSGKFYMVSFPYSEAASKMMGDLAGAFYEPSIRGWHYPWQRAEILEDRLAKIDQCLRDEGFDVDTPEVTLTRQLMIDTGDLAPGLVLETDEGAVTIDRVGKAFTGTRFLAKSTGLKVTNKPVRYVWHRPSLDAEIEAAGLGEQIEDPVPM